MPSPGRFFKRPRLFISGTARQEEREARRAKKSAPEQTQNREPVVSRSEVDRANETKRRAEEAKRQAEAVSRQANEDKQRAEEAKVRVEGELQQANDAKERAEAVSRQANADKQRAEEAKVQVEARLQRTEAELQQANETNGRLQMQLNQVVLQHKKEKKEKAESIHNYKVSGRNQITHDILATMRWTEERRINFKKKNNFNDPHNTQYLFIPEKLSMEEMKAFILSAHIRGVNVVNALDNEKDVEKADITKLKKDLMVLGEMSELDDDQIENLKDRLIKQGSIKSIWDLVRIFEQMGPTPGVTANENNLLMFSSSANGLERGAGSSVQSSVSLNSSATPNDARGTQNASVQQDEDEYVHVTRP